VWALWHALTTFRWELRFLTLWIGLEALFGVSAAAGETRYRLSQRIAFFNAANRNEAERLFQVAMHSYQWRSRVVHGLRLREIKPDDRLNLDYDAQTLLRKSLVRVLEDSSLIAQLNSSQRERYLDGLIFSD